MDKTTDRAVSLVMIGISCTLWYFMPDLSPGFKQSIFPRLAVIIILISSLLLLVKTFFISYEGNAEAEQLTGRRINFEIFLLLLIWGIYIFLLDYIGYYGGIFLVLVVSIKYLGKQEKIMTVCFYSLLAVAVIYLVFGMGFNLRLP